MDLTGGVRLLRRDREGERWRLRGGVEDLLLRRGGEGDLHAPVLSGLWGGSHVLTVTGWKANSSVTGNRSQGPFLAQAAQWHREWQQRHSGVC